MIHQAVDSAVSAENASRFQQPLGKPFGFTTIAAFLVACGLVGLALLRRRASHGKEVSSSLEHGMWV